jgi:methenyltetrahydromethanopterin cyclohydrolase
MEIVRDMMDRKDELQCEVVNQSNGTTLIDAGLDVPGGIEIGRLCAEACLGGLGAVRVTRMHVGDMTLPSVVIGTDQPKLATLGSQHAGWEIKTGDYVAVCSGPARALGNAEKELFDKLEYKDDSRVGVLCLETSEPPPESVTQSIADSCGISATDLYCILAPATSLAGCVLTSARVVDTGVYRLMTLGFKPAGIRTGHGIAPIAPVKRDSDVAMGVTNDCLLYGGRAFFFVKADENEELDALVNKASSSASSLYGQPLYYILKSVAFDFHKLDPALLGPAEITVNDITSGRTLKAGGLNPEVLRQSLAIG